jgi:hypothetical protein
MMFEGTSTRVLDSSLTTVKFIGKSQIKTQRNVAKTSGHFGGLGGRKWVEKKSRLK